MKGIKTVKRFLLAYVILAMACMGIMTNYTTAEAATTFKTWECYKADYYLQCSPYSYYMSDKFSAPYRSIVKENSTSDVFNGLLTSWEIATFSLSNVTEYSQKRTGYYEAFLYDVLYQGYDQKTLMGALKKGAKSTQASALKSVTKLLKKTEMSYGKTKLASMSDEEMKNFAKSLKECNELSAVFGVVSDVTTVFSYATTVEEVLYKASKAATIMNTASENADILDRIANATTDASLKKACNNLASICRKEVSEDELVQIMLKDEAVDEIQNKVMSKIWSKVIEQLGTYGIAVKAGQSLGKAFAELFFSTNTQVETYYEMKCLYEFEDRLTDAVRTYAANYSSNATTANAKLFNNAFEMLMQTYELGCDIAVTYNESTYNKGALNILVSRISGDIDKFNKYKDSVNFIKRTIDEVYTFATNDMYNSYLEDCCADVADTVEMAPVENVGTKEELDNQLVALEANVQKASNMYISGDYKLTGDIETYGSLYLSGGTLDLNGYTLTIHGDIHQTNGVLFVDGGKLTVDGDYGIYRTQKNSTTGDTEIICTDGYLKMVKAADSVTVGGNLTVCIDEDTSRYLTAGTLVLKGNFRQIYDGYSTTAYGFCATGTHTTILAGEGTQELSFDSSASGFNELKTAEGYQGKIALKNNIKFNKLGSDLAVTGENLYIGDSKLNGHKLSVTGNATMYADVDLQGGEWEVTGNLRQTYGILYVNGGKLTVDGDYGVYQTQENITTGDTEIAYTSGYLKMVKAADSVTVGGDLTVCTYTSGYLTAGTLVLKGNFRQAYDDRAGSGSYGFCATGTHTTILAGEGTQELSFDSSASGFNELKTAEGYQGKIALKNNIKFNKLGSDLAVTGENLYIGDSKLNGHKLSVTGNATMYADVDLQGGEWEVTGNLRQTYGILYVNGGKLTVDGDYGVYQTQENITTGDTEIAYTSGYLKMVKAADSVTVGGDLTVCTYYTSGYLTAGTLVLKGNFRQIYGGSSYGFCATGTHTTILAGEGTQHITFDSTASQFNNLKLTGDKDTDYVFSREVCWNQIYMNTDVRAVNVYPKDKILIKGTAWKFTAAVAGINKPSQEVTWSVEGASGSQTQISEAGILTVDLHETADTLKVRAVSRQDPQYSGSVTVTLQNAIPVVEWVQITPNHVGLGLGDSKQFEAVVYGENEPEQTVIWQVTGNTSPDTMIDEDGILYIGRDELADSVVIEATSKLDETKKASETVSILRTTISENTIVEKVHVSPQKADVEVGQSRQYKAVVMGVNGPSQDVQWSVSNNSCPSTRVDASGLLTVADEEEAGELTVIATSVENEQIMGTATVSVVRLSILPVADKVIILLKPGDTIALSARVLGANAPSQAVNWRIEGNMSDKTLIDENGVLSIGKNEKTNKITVIAASDENPEIENRVQFDVQPSTCMHTNTEVRNQKESTCLEKGYTGDIFCKDCEDQVGIGNEIPAKGHAWDAGKVVKEATYEEAGIILYTCQTCGAQKQDDLDRLQRPETDEKTQENKKQQTDNGKTDGEQTGQKEKLSGGELIKQKNAEYIVKSDGTVSCGKVKNVNGKLTIPDTVQDENGNTYAVSEVGKDAFKDNKSVTEVVIGNKVKTIAVNAFAGCSKLKKVVLGNAVEVISDNAFANCGKLQTVTMKKKVTRIGARAFYKCKSLKKIVIPASVKKIGKQAFYQCKNLRSITIKTTKLTKKRVGSNAFKGIHAKAKIKVPKKKLALYKKVLRSRGVGKKAKIMK